MDEVSDTEGVSFVSKVPAGQVVVPELQLPEQDSRSDAVVGGLEAQASTMQALPAQESSLPSLQQALDAYEAVEFGNAHLGASRSRLHEAFRKEQELVALNQPRVHEKWRAIMRKAKSEDLRKEVQWLADAHNSVMQRKDALIQRLAGEIETQEELHAKASGDHFALIEAMMTLQQSSLQSMLTHFQIDLQELEASYTREHNSAQATHAQHRAALSAVSTAMEAEFARLETETKNAFRAAKRIAKNQGAEDFNMAKLLGETRQEELGRAMAAEHRAYLKATQARSEELEQLRSENAKTLAAVEGRRGALARGGEQITAARVAVESASRECSTSSAAIREEISELAPQYAKLKLQRNGMHKAHSERMKRLSVASATAEARLNARLAAGKRLLSLVHLASKYEAEHETVGADTPDILLQDAGLAQKLSADAQAAGAFGSSMGSHVEAGTLPELAKFQIHYSKVLLEKTLIDQENSRLLAVIHALKHQLREGMVLSESTGWNRKADTLMQSYSCVSLRH